MKIAILQDSFSGGGRTSVVLRIIEVLNDLGITPDILSCRIGLSTKTIEQNYGKSLHFKIKKIKEIFTNKLPDSSKLLFNLLSRSYLKNYNLIIESNNTSCLLPNNIRLISYIHYPRIDRVYEFKDIHLPEKKYSFKTLLGKYLDYLIASSFYHFQKLNPENLIIANSLFTRNAIISRYKLNPENIKILYPPVNISCFCSNKTKNDSVVTLGSFSEAKGQLQQIKIAENLPYLRFNIIGFSKPDNTYYQKCVQYIHNHNIGNVFLYPNLAYKSMIKILQTSKYYLHTMIKEPFGISTIQGIAAGCIPIVPDSGGQIEIVPIPELRYGSWDEAIKIINNINKNQNLEIFKKKLLNHIQQFSEENFKNRFQEILKELINSK